ncbi:TKL protein kinase [Saprolegnia diclina VS20]|uniref:TKL protein kinase n=1 Tax=Saprolegnia diclina (strain VS20) TaxID=1156394 RepID=T0QT73_SAPDV|nr:TKL protein kinase [Saprolegnia diclina VS20]EQC41379.1 TKL protein kinase [Saprolegnia diclina VS20]|eukprot:XP_008605093.1 TKL protein kinase [Saprolegnia diclina VS20]
MLGATPPPQGGSPFSPFRDYEYLTMDFGTRSHVESVSLYMNANQTLLLDSVKSLQTGLGQLPAVGDGHEMPPSTRSRRLCAQWRCDMQLWQRLRSNWDASVLWATLVAILLMLAAAFALTYIIDEQRYTNIHFGAHMLCLLPEWNATVKDTASESNIKMLSTILTLGNYLVIFVVSAFLAVQCRATRRKILANPNNTNLTSVFVLPCYDMVWFTLLVVAVYSISVMAVSITVSMQTIWAHRGAACFLIYLPTSWIMQLLPILMVQKSISKAAVQRSMLLSGAVSAVLLSVMVLDKGHIAIFFIVFHAVSIGFYTWAKFISFSRASFDYIYIVLVASSLVGILPPVMLLIRSPDEDDMYYYLYVTVTVIGNLIDCFGILGIMLTLRADTKYWLGIDYNSLHTKDPAKLYLRLIAERGMVSSFSTRTSVYDVHYMIEEFKKSMVDFSLLDLESVVAQGATAVVLRGSMQRTLRDAVPVAIKMYTSLFVTDDDVRRFSKETSLNIGLSHPNIVRFYGLCVVPPAICLVFEYCEWGSLELVLLAQNRSTTEWDLPTKLKACLDACRAVAYLHSFSPPLLHRDIKTANFLLASDAMLKLSDFGESNLMRPKNDGTMTVVGSVDFMAPEMISGGRPASAVYGTAADVYSLTMTLWHILAPGRNPWKGRSHFEVYTEVTQGRRPTIPLTLPPDCVDLLENGWAADPAKRLSVQEIAARFQTLWLLASHRQHLPRTGRLQCGSLD